MKLIKLECPNCKSILEVNEEMKKFTCNYCGTTTLLDDEIIRVKHYNSRLDDILNEIEEYYDNGNDEKCIELTNKYIVEYPSNAKLKKFRFNSVKKVIKKNYSSEHYVECVKMFNYLDDFSSDKELLKIYHDVTNIIENHTKHEESKSRLILAIFSLIIFGFLFFCIFIVAIRTYSQYHNFTENEASFIFPQLVIYGIPTFLSLWYIIFHKEI